MWNGSKIGTGVVDGRKDHFYFMRKLVQSAIESRCGYSGLTTILAVVNIKICTTRLTIFKNNKRAQH